MQSRLAGKRACVIGAGFGGLALAIRLQAAGLATTLIEARAEPGGQAQQWRHDGFIFDAGPGLIADPGALRELWALTGHDLADDVELLPVSTGIRFSWPDGSHFDLGCDSAELRREMARFAPADVAGYDALLRHLAHSRHQLPGETNQPAPDAGAMAKALPAMLRLQAWRSVYDTVSRFITSTRLREALSVQVLMRGGNPMAASSLSMPGDLIRPTGNCWCIRGGTSRLAAGMARQFERLGGTLRLGDAASRVEVLGNRATGVTTRSGWHEDFDSVASNADIVHSYRKLLGHTQRGRRQARALARKPFGPGLFAVHFALEGSWPGIPQHMVLFGPRFAELLNDIFNIGVLPQDQLIFLHHPTVTDPGLAPTSKSTFQAVMPVAHLGKLPIDWRQIGPMLEKRMIDEVGRRLIPDIHDRVIHSFHYAPPDLAQDLGAHLGSAFSIEPRLMQSGGMRPRNRDEMIGNFHLVGAGTWPGAGLSAVLHSAGAAAGLMLEELTQ